MHHKYDLLHFQNEMKFIAFFAFVATVSAITKVYPSTHVLCHPEDIPAITKCGDTKLTDYDVRGARIVYDGDTVLWFEDEKCEGHPYAEADTSKDCFAFPFDTPKCVKIFC